MSKDLPRNEQGRSIDQHLLSVGEMVPPNAIRRLHGPPQSAFAHHDRFFGGSWDTESGTIP